MSFISDETITQEAVDRWSTAHTPRLAEVMTHLVRHLHAFAREIELTNEEWFAAVQFLTKVGQICDDKRQEFCLLSDVMGLSMLCVMRNGVLPDGATPQTVLGPFHVDGSPELASQERVPGEVEGEPLFLSGRITDLDGAPIEGASIDFWQADGEGTYETQIPDSPPRLRGIYRTGADGRFDIVTVAAKGYSIPMDGPVGDLMRQTEISHFRPAHLHAIISRPGFETIVTQIFKQGTPFLNEDAVFGVREALVAPFVRHEGGVMPNGVSAETPFYTVDFDFVLSSVVAAATHRQDARGVEAAVGR